jgi:hypothetical protein
MIAIFDTDTMVLVKPESHELAHRIVKFPKESKCTTTSAYSQNGIICRCTYPDIMVWYDEDGTEFFTGATEQHIRHVFFSSDGTFILVQSHECISVWDIQKRSRLWKKDIPHMLTTTISYDSTRIMTFVYEDDGGGGLRHLVEFDSQNGEQISYGHDFGHTAVFSSNGSVLISGLPHYHIVREPTPPYDIISVFQTGYRTCNGRMFPSRWK